MQTKFYCRTFNPYHFVVFSAENNVQSISNILAKQLTKEFYSPVEILYSEMLENFIMVLNGECYKIQVGEVAHE